MGEKDVSEMMPIRVIGYDGSAYRAQLSEYDSEVRKWMELNKQKPKKLKPDMKQHERPVFHPAPVITIVLYFGLDHWDKKLHLKDLLDIPDILDPYVNDYKITVFEIAWLSDEQIDAFKSDFQIIARFLSKKRKREDYDLQDTKEFIHAAETLNLLSALTGDEMYTYANTPEMNKKYGGEPKNMCEYIRRIWNNGISDGIKQGIEQGLQQGLQQGIEQGIEQGLEQGIQKGLEQGIQQGLEQGIELRDKQKIEEMLKSGKTPQAISEFCMYPLDLVLNVKESMGVA